MSVTTATRTKFWILCHEETETTLNISKAVSNWELPGLNARLGHQFPHAVAAAIAEADYALFITPHTETRHDFAIRPLSLTQSINAPIHSPASLLATLHNRHGQAPQAWLAQVSPPELSTPQALEQELSQLKEFVHPYVFGPAVSEPQRNRPNYWTAQPQWRNCRKAHRI